MHFNAELVLFVKGSRKDIIGIDYYESNFEGLMAVRALLEGGGIHPGQWILDTWAQRR